MHELIHVSILIPRGPNRVRNGYDRGFDDKPTPRAPGPSTQ